MLFPDDLENVEALMSNQNIIEFLADQTPIMAALPFPDIDPVAFSIGIFSIRWYALAYIGGILLGWLFLRRLLTSPDDPVGRPPLDDLLNYGIIGIIIGGRLGYVLGYNVAYYAQHPLEILFVWQGGMSFHGGFVGLVVSGFLVARKYKIPFLALADIVVFGVPIGLFFGRIANFINGELYGRVSDVPWAFIFPNGGPLPRHPTQLYEAFLEGVVLFVIIGVAYRNGARQKPGLMLGIFMAGYAFCRILVEFIREPDAHLGFIFGQITMGQILSLPMLLIGVFAILYAHRKSKA
jgi:phosphatidylglycerol:prolipoprotein diacylglycerol transferase